jgi:RNA polymerase-interacting CarD/CdnL/TRCF family regulator
MTMHLEIQIEELRAELRNAGERRQITAALEILRAELAVIAADQDKTIESVPLL